MRLLLAILMVLGVAGMAYAAPVGLTSEADLTQGELLADSEMGATISFIYDAIEERAVEIDNGEFAMQAFLARIGLSLMDRFNLYVDIGQTSDMEYIFVDKGEKHTVQLDDEIIWGVGANALIHRWDNGIEVGAGASYRQADMTLESVNRDGADFQAAALTAISNGEFKEYQAAIEVAWKNDVITPYAGIKFSDVEVDAKFTEGGQERNATGKNASENIGAFVGLAISPTIESLGSRNSLALNVEGRFVDEEAISVGVSYKF